MTLSCENIRREVLDWGWGRARREEISACLAHLENCLTCQAAVGDYDALLARFQQEQEAELPPAAGWDAFEHRLTRQITSHEGEDRSLRAESTQRGTLPKTNLSRFLGRSMSTALAASLVLAALGWGMYWGGERARQPGPAIALVNRPTTPPTGTEVSEGARLFGKVSSVFDNRTSWVLMGGNTSDVGISDDEAPAGDQLLFVRLVLSIGSRAISTAELVIVPGRSADLTLPTASGYTVQYHLTTRTGDPTRVQISASVSQRDLGDTQASLTTQVLATPGHPVHVGELETSTGRLRLELAVQPTHVSGKSA